MISLSDVKRYIDRGLVVIPCVNKRPIPKGWQTSYTPVLSDFKNATEVGLVCTHGMEVVDFDNKLINSLTTIKSVLQDLPFIKKLAINETRSGGYHVIYRCSKVEGNQKMAKEIDFVTKEIFTTIETRGVGGQIIIPPSPGYTKLQGDVMHLNYITPEEREILLSKCRAYNTITPEIVENTAFTKNGEAVSSRFNVMPNSHLVAFDCLKSHGWTMLSGGKEWARPGRKTKSASWTGKCFYSWSSNCYPFEEQKGYSPFAVICLLDYNGDYMECARNLAKEYNDYI